MTPHSTWHPECYEQGLGRTWKTKSFSHLPVCYPSSSAKVRHRNQNTLCLRQIIQTGTLFLQSKPLSLRRATLTASSSSTPSLLKGLAPNPKGRMSSMQRNLKHWDRLCKSFPYPVYNHQVRSFCQTHFYSFPLVFKHQYENNSP